MRKRQSLQQWIVLISSLFLVLACAIPGSSQSGGSLEQTQVAMGVQQTVLAQKQTQIAEKPEPTKEPVHEKAPTDAPAKQAEAPTYTPYPTYTVPPTTAPTETKIPEEEPTQAPTEVNITDRIKKANILVFEDIRGYPDLTPWVSQAIRSMDFRGGKIVEVGDAVGDFMVNLNSPMKWDLIIVAAESRTQVRGEFWDIILDQVNHNVGLISEIWYLDEIASGRISPLLSKCGIRFQSDWSRAPGGDPLEYSLSWLDQFNDVFAKPNVVGPLYTSVAYWAGDVGDTISLAPGSGDATLLAGLYAKEKSKYGTLATCMDGRVIFQTFSSHDYRQSQVIPLWQNYITYTLTNHFKASE